MKKTDLHPSQSLVQELDSQLELAELEPEDFRSMELPEGDFLKLLENVNMVYYKMRWKRREEK